MKIDRLHEATELRQEDCYWHDHAEDLCYVLVLPGSVPMNAQCAHPSAFTQAAGRVSETTREYLHLSVHEPGVMPGRTGPVTVLLVL